MLASTAIDAIESSITYDPAHAIARFGDFTLASHFQPIFSLAHGRAVGVEGLLRARDGTGKAISPVEMFQRADDAESAVLLDRLCRAIHVHNFVAQRGNDGWLFLNVSPRVVVGPVQQHGSFFRSLLERAGCPPHRVVVEILESALADENRLNDAVAYYRDLGCLIAIDDFGAGHSNFDRIWRLRPDIVKFDRSIVIQAASNPQVQALIPGMVSLIHEAGSLVVMEGVETEREAIIAMDSDADFVQGYYFARPAELLATTLSAAPTLNNLFSQFKSSVAHERDDYWQEIAPYINALGYSSVLLKAGQPLGAACNSFLALPRGECCFLLDESGQQIDDNMVAPHFQIKLDSRYDPLKDGSGANWSRRHYFRRALSQPEKLHVSRPYLSVSTARQCITVSIGVKINGKLHVLCGDVCWDQRFLAVQAKSA